MVAAPGPDTRRSSQQSADADDLIACAAKGMLRRIRGIPDAESVVSARGTGTDMNANNGTRGTEHPMLMMRDRAIERADEVGDRQVVVSSTTRSW